MSEEKFDAKVDQLKGNGKEFIGKVTGDKEVETEGEVDKLVGKAKELFTNAKDTIDGAVEGLKNQKKDDKEL
ncbi:CsbD family protein [Streptococcus ferus]|uniref:MF3-like protein n=1 Tax=Streptococcus ferus TaxID=1345 RepID=A0A2X3W0N5_9STRE|nr:CsbD family protein [Streptococcus ferus]SQF39187.1 MF3-like protein [Streptococcus ferus]